MPEDIDTGFSTLFGEDEPAPKSKPEPAEENPERAANIRAHVALGVKLFGNRANFAAAAGASAGSVTNWLAGKVPRELSGIAEALGIEADALGCEPSADLIARAEASTAPKRARKRRKAEPEECEATPAAAEETEKTPASDQAAPVPTEVFQEGVKEDVQIAEEVVPAEPDGAAVAEVQEAPGAAEPPRPLIDPNQLQNALGERLAAFMTDKEWSIHQLAEEMGEKGAEGRIKTFLTGECVPSLMEFRTLAGILDISVNRLRFEAYLPSAALLAQEGFAQAAEDAGLVLKTESQRAPEPEALREAADAVDQAEEAQKDPKAVPAEEPVRQEEDGTLSLALGDFDQGDCAMPSILSCRVENGLLADLARKGCTELFTVPNNDLTPALNAGETVVIDRRRFESGEASDRKRIGVPGWYLIKLGGVPVIRYLSFRENVIYIRGSNEPVESADTIEVIGSAAAKITVTAV